MMRQHKHGYVIWRLFTPPSIPSVVWPRTTDRAKHVSPKNPSTHVGQALFREFIVCSGFTACAAAHFVKYLRRKTPIHDVREIFSKWIGETLIRTCAITIKR